MEIGRVNQLKAARAVEFGLFLADEDGKEVLLPKRYVPEDVSMGDAFDAFVYKDSENRLTASLERPAAMLDEFAYLKVASVSTAGAFLSWGLAKDLFVPFSEQRARMQPEQSYVVRICLDEETDRLFASSQLDDFVCEFADGYEENDEVDLIVAEQTDLGYKVIVDEGCWGLLYKEEIFTTLELGQAMTGYVKSLRKDARLDICLQKAGYDRVNDVEARILQALKDNNGALPLSSKSAPELIYDTFGVSKKAFKLGVSALYRKRLISIDDGLRLKDADSITAEASTETSVEAPAESDSNDPWANARKASK